MNYDSKYSAPGFYWKLKPHALTVASIKHLPVGARVLDLGCGQGRDSFYFAQQNFEVTAVDLSVEGIEKLNEFAQKEKLEIRAYASDIKSYLKDCEEFDGIYATNVLQFIDGENIHDVVKQMQLKTAKNGLNVVASFVSQTPEQRENALSRGRYLFNEGELRELYKEWEIISYEETLSDWETHGEPPHKHFYIEMVARKQ